MQSSAALPHNTWIFPACQSDPFSVLIFPHIGSWWEWEHLFLVHFSCSLKIPNFHSTSPISPSSTCYNSLKKNNPFSFIEQVSHDTPKEVQPWWLRIHFYRGCLNINNMITWQSSLLTASFLESFLSKFLIFLVSFCNIYSLDGWSWLRICFLRL